MISIRGDIVIRIPNWIGDAVLCTAAVKALRTSLPDCRITAVVKPWVKDVFLRSSAVDELIVYRHRRGPRRFLDAMALVRRLHQENFAAAVLFQTAFESALLPFLARIPVRIGRPTDHRRLFLTHSVALTQEEQRSHQVYHYLAVARRITGDVKQQFEPEVELSEVELEAARRWLGESASGPLITVAAGAAYGSAKRWLPERFAAFSDAAGDLWNARVVFCGGGGDLPVIDTIRRHCSRPVDVIAGEKPLPVQAALIAMSDVCVSNDSGLMHLAAAVGTPVVAIFGPTDSTATGPWGSGHRVLHEAVECAPCKYRDCPLNHECMRRITVEKVLSAVQKIFEAKKNQV